MLHGKSHALTSANLNPSWQFLQEEPEKDQRVPVPYHWVWYRPLVIEVSVLGSMQRQWTE
jgi:hypothetical protein